MNIVGFHEFLVSQLKGDFVCNLGSTAKAMCLSRNILVAKAKALPLLDSSEAASYIIAGHCCQ